MWGTVTVVPHAVSDLPSVNLDGSLYSVNDEFDETSIREMPTGTPLNVGANSASLTASFTLLTGGSNTNMTCMGRSSICSCVEPRTDMDEAGVGDIVGLT